MVHPHADVIVAGHICLDIIPTFGERTGGLETLFVPGTLVNVGPAVTATGGAIPNTGLALYRLGVLTTLMGKVGSDLFGHAILELLRSHDDTLAQGMIVDSEVATSYTVVLNPPGIDRIFLHFTGANDTFIADDVDTTRLAGAKIFHFGYPPLMRYMYRDEGSELATLMQRVKASGLTTSLDMAYPDPNSEAGQADWSTILGYVLPYVDVFLPSLDEILFMLDRPRFEALAAGGALTRRVDGALLHELAGRLLEMGAAIVALKLGDQGLYVRTAANADRLATMGASTPHDVAAWTGRELLAPCFQTTVVGTTGAGDCTIAGFLAGLLRNLPIEDVVTAAVAVGAFSVESPDATSRIPLWNTVRKRIRAGWERRDVLIALDGWTHDTTTHLWIGPGDAKEQHV